MTWTAYLDESGANDDSPIMLMGGFLASAEQWERFDSEWRSLLSSSGIQYCHGTELVHGTKEFRGWSYQRRLAFQEQANRIIPEYIELGVTAIIRKDDYNSIYKAAPNPKKLRKDSKYAVLFRGCLWAVLAAVTDNLEIAKQSQVNFVLEAGAKNSGDAIRLFELGKENLIAEWSSLLGTLTLGTKESPGLQAADLLVYASNRLERMDHSAEPTDIGNSSHIVVQGTSILFWFSGNDLFERVGKLQGALVGLVG
jgi:hypothetical protein